MAIYLSNRVQFSTRAHDLPGVGFSTRFIVSVIEFCLMEITSKPTIYLSRGNTTAAGAGHLVCKIGLIAGGIPSWVRLLMEQHSIFQDDGN